MADVAFDSLQHAQTRADIRDGGSELNSSAGAAVALATAQVFGHWTTEHAAQDMGAAVRSFLLTFAATMANEASFLDEFDTKVAQCVNDFTGTEEDARAALAAVGTALLGLNRSESARRVYSEDEISTITGQNPDPQQAATGATPNASDGAGVSQGQRSESGAPLDAPTYGNADAY